MAPELARLASEVVSPAEAMDRFDAWASETRAIGLTVDLASAALGRVAAIGVGGQRFVAELFAELTDYYASRDLPSVVGAAGRVATPAAAIALKERLKDVARSQTLAEGPPPDSVDRWVAYIRRIVSRLAAGKP